jgi:hypothetical protein
MFRPTKCFCLAVALALAVSATARAQYGDYIKLVPNGGVEVVLQDLLSGQAPGLWVGDKLFDNFSYSSTGDMPEADRVVVTAITDAVGNYGIRFQGAFADFPDMGNQLASDAGITFEVAVDPDHVRQGWIITDAHLYGAGANSNGDGAFIAVDESFTGNTPVIADTMQVYLSTIGQGGRQFEDSVVFNQGYTRLRVQKDVIARAGEGNIGPVRMTIIEQTFSQDQEVIPEPATLGLLGLAITGFAAVRRQRS